MSRVQVLDGFTAYGIAVKHGFQGTETEWLESIPATIGENGNWWVDGKDTGVLADPAKLLSLTQRAENAAIHQPYPDTNTGTWWCWDAEAGAYTDSGIKAKADELKIAGPDVLGGVQPVAKTDTMTIPVGVDDAGRLYSGKDPDVDRLKSDLVQLSEAKADKEFVINIFEQLKVLIEAGKTDESIAVLDEAILDLAILA